MSDLTEKLDWRGPAMVLAGGICIGFAPIGVRFGFGDLGPQAIAFWRYVFALPFLFVIACIVQKGLPSKPNKFVLIAGTFFACDMALWHWGLETTTVANATFLVNLGNLFVGLLAWFILREKPGKLWFYAVPLAVIGAAALSLGGGEAGKGDIRGDILCLGAAFMVAFYVVFSKRARETLGGYETIFWLTCVEVVVGFLFVTGSGESFMPDDLSGFKVPLFLAVVVQTMGQGLIITGLGRTPASIAGVLVLIQPVVASAVAWVLFDEPLVGLQMGGAALILAGIWLAGQSKPIKV